jgi:hypothetical protein
VWLFWLELMMIKQVCPSCDPHHLHFNLFLRKDYKDHIILLIDLQDHPEYPCEVIFCDYLNLNSCQGGLLITANIFPQDYFHFTHLHYVKWDRMYY